MTKDDKDLIRFTKKALRIPSFSGKEKRVALFFKKAMEETGFDEVSIDEYGNVLGIINGSDRGKTVLIDGHMDTVDVIDKDKWMFPPFSAKEVDGRIYARGSSDMKSSVCASIIAAAEFKKKTGGFFKGRVAIAGIVHEDCFEGIACKGITDRIMPDFVIIGEATSGSVKIGGRGRAEICVETEGVSCHSSNPEKGINAVYLMKEAIGEIQKIKANKHPVLGKGILELTDIISYPYPGSSVLPSVCRATFDRRTLTGESKESVLSEVNDALKRVQQRNKNFKAKSYIKKGEADCWTGYRITADRFFPAWCYDQNDEMIKKSIEGLKKAHLPHKISHFSFCTNGAHYCGTLGIKGIGYGPSEEFLAHIRDEYIEIDSLLKVKKGYVSILESLLE